MNHWDDVDARANATLEFVKRLKGNPELITDCKTDPQKAKETFAEGFFYLEGQPQPEPDQFRWIPNKTVFRVYEYDPKDDRDDLVCLVLPNPKRPQDKKLEAREVWLCTWAPYRE